MQSRWQMSRLNKDSRPLLFHKHSYFSGIGLPARLQRTS